MTQATQADYDEEEVRRREQAVGTQQLYRTDALAIPPEMNVAFAIVTIAVLLVISVTALTGSTWAFPFVYVPTAIVYIAGALYLFKRLMDYQPKRARQVAANLGGPSRPEPGIARKLE